MDGVDVVVRLRDVRQEVPGAYGRILGDCEGGRIKRGGQNLSSAVARNHAARDRAGVLNARIARDRAGLRDARGRYTWILRRRSIAIARRRLGGGREVRGGGSSREIGAEGERRSRRSERGKGARDIPIGADTRAGWVGRLGDAPAEPTMSARHRRPSVVGRAILFLGGSFAGVRSRLRDR